MMRKPLSLVALVLAAAIAMIGCSNSDPMGVFGGSSATTAGSPSIYSSPGDQVHIQARIATVNQISRMLTFEGVPDTVIAEQNCEITRFNGSEYAPIPFSEVHQGDFAQAWGSRMQNGDVLATRLRICNQSGDPNYDVAFRDTIVTIDYASGTFTVAGRSETIFVDPNTLIWTTIDGNRFHHSLSGGDPNAAGNKYNYKGSSVDTALAFSDLIVGDVVEVKADITSEIELLALKIKVANCDLSRCIQFTDLLASVDMETRLVTFQTETWVGFVGQGVNLTGLDGEPLELDDFVAGDYVFVKGFPLEDGTLKICQMTKQAL